MKNILILILTTIFIQGCFSSFDQEVEYKIDPLLKPYVDTFYEEAERRGLALQRYNLIVTIDSYKIDPYNLGESRKEGDQRVVLINKKHYDRFIAEGEVRFIERLVMHELGHAVLDRRHLQTFSIMNSGSYYQEFKVDSIRTALINELFIY
jgi:hypothetical protein